MKLVGHKPVIDWYAIRRASSLSVLRRVGDANSGLITHGLPLQALIIGKWYVDVDSMVYLSRSGFMVGQDLVQMIFCAQSCAACSSPQLVGYVPSNLRIASSVLTNTQTSINLL
jgi:hypothetical protein